MAAESDSMRCGSAVRPKPEPIRRRAGLSILPFECTIAATASARGNSGERTV